MKNDRTVKVGISLGDLNGIGSELVFKSLMDYDLLEFCTPVVFANKRLMSFLKKELNVKLHFHGVEKASEALANKVNVVNVWKERVEIQLGEPSEAVAAYTGKALEAATQALKEGAIDILVNAPGGDYNEETEGCEVARLLRGNMLRMRVNEDFLWVNLQSRPLNPKNNFKLKEFYKEIQQLQNSLLEDFRISRPRIAVLMPCWEKMDSAEAEKKATAELGNALRKLDDEGLLIYGLYNRNSFFENDRCHQFDAIVDFKMNEAEACFGGWALPHAINFYAGLEQVVTNPNRSVDYALAGKDKIAPDDFRQALYAGIDIFRRREEYKVFSANPLKKKSLKKRR